MTITEGFAHDDSKGCRMLKLSWTLLGLLMFLLPAGANAVPLTYNLSGVTFSDSGTASGSFQYDAVTNAYSNVNIITTNGGSRSGATYNSVSGGFAPDSGGILLVTMAGAGQTGLPGLALFFSPVLNGAGGMSTLTGEEANCVDPECTMPSGTMRTITAGTVSAGAAATPMTWFLTGFTFADGATATGSFVFDASTHSFSSVNIATTTATRTGATYNTLSTGLIPDATGALFDTSVAPNQTGLPGFSMFFSSPLTGAGGTSTVTGKEADCADPGCSTPTGTMRLITDQDSRWQFQSGSDRSDLYDHGNQFRKRTNQWNGFGERRSSFGTDGDWDQRHELELHVGDGVLHTQQRPGRQRQL